MDVFPVFMNLRDRNATVVGGGAVAARKVELLVRAGARVTVVAPELCTELDEAQQEGRISHLPETFEERHLGRAVLVVAATDDRAVNRRVSSCARAHRIPVNVVDDPGLSTFITPSVIDRAPLVIAVSSGGASPVLTRMLRARLETLVPATYGRLAVLAAAFRDAVRSRIPSPASRRHFWERTLGGPIGGLVLDGRESDARRLLMRALNEPGGSVACPGSVHLIGGGPGDPELLTLKALRVLQEADVVVYDHLVSDAVLDLARRDARRICVGKRCDKHTMPQEQINELLVRLARQGLCVARLKGGDPYVFGRGGEEAEVLVRAGVTVHVVPGITAACGIAAATGVPLTHRDHAHACVFVTGHLKNGAMTLDWEALARPGQTVVIYMGLRGLPELCRQFIANGRSASTPAMIVARGTRPDQAVVTGTLGTLPGLATDALLGGPTLIVVGEVVSLREVLGPSSERAPLAASVPEFVAR